MTSSDLSYFHPDVAAWFLATYGQATAPQLQSWPLIQRGVNVLIAAPTGTGKTFAGFLSAINDLLSQGDQLQDATQVLYVSPLKALSNDIQKNLLGPLQELRAGNGQLPEIRVMTRTGDTPAAERVRMIKKPPHIVVTTPESLYLLLTSESGRTLLRTLKTVIVDEIHALAPNKRGSHLALSLERLNLLTNNLQRIGLSATQKPVEDIARFLVGPERSCEIVNIGHVRTRDLAIVLPDRPLAVVCSHEHWDEIYNKIADLVGNHRTTLLFVNTRKMAERIAARLIDRLGQSAVASHHGSLAKELRLNAEQRLKDGKLKVLVATASLELGIDIGDVDLVIQVGMPTGISVFLQRVGRAGHSINRIPKGQLFPLTSEEFLSAVALFKAVSEGDLDRIAIPEAPLDILAQQIVAACACEDFSDEDLCLWIRSAWPYRNLSDEDIRAVIALHTQGRGALLHVDGIGRRIMGTRRSRLAALNNGGAIPDLADYEVRLEPDNMLVGTLNEDFAIESNVGDIFQLGASSWQIARIEPGIVRVLDAKGMPPTLPFWLGEAPGYSNELMAAISDVRECGSDLKNLASAAGISSEQALLATEMLCSVEKSLGVIPSRHHIVAERFFDQTGGMQLIIHSPFGSRINRAWGLAIRKKFCRGFGFELQAAATEEAILLSLGPQHSFPLVDVFSYLHPKSAGEVLQQALLAAPVLLTRWRWNVTRALVVARRIAGKKVPAPLLRMRSDDALVQAFPQLLACFETLPPGDVPIPTDHPLVRQSMHDACTEAMDVEGFLAVLEGIFDGSIATSAVETSEPSLFAEAVLHAKPYAFLDDAPLEERRVQAVISRRGHREQDFAELGDLDPLIVERIVAEAWPDPRDAEETHAALLWMAYVTVDEARGWEAWIGELEAAGRIRREGLKIFAMEHSGDPLAVLRGRLEISEPQISCDQRFLELEVEGVAIRVRFRGQEAWCHRRLLARIRAATLESLRREQSSVSSAAFLYFLFKWQHVDRDFQVEGPAGVEAVLRQLSWLDISAIAWEKHVLKARVKDYERDWLDFQFFSGKFLWLRLFPGAALTPGKIIPITIVPREDLPVLSVVAPGDEINPTSAIAQQMHGHLRTRGASFVQDLLRTGNWLPSHAEAALQELVSLGLITADSFALLRLLCVPPAERRKPLALLPGRISLVERIPSDDLSGAIERVARVLLDRYGVIFPRLLAKESLSVSWRELLRVYRTLELRGEVRGGRFVQGYSGEQFALPQAVSLLRGCGKEDKEPLPSIAASDPLNVQGILTPGPRHSGLGKGTVQLRL